jgi:hypothetical protein
MFYSRKKSRISLVRMVKATTFAPALREKHSTTCKTSFKKNNQTFFQKHLVGKIKSPTFAPALREKLTTNQN